eukprot:1899517-Rhodomonas_salina.3
MEIPAMKQRERVTVGQGARMRELSKIQLSINFSFLPNLSTCACTKFGGKSIWVPGSTDFRETSGERGLWRDCEENGDEGKVLERVSLLFFSGCDRHSQGGFSRLW